LQEHIIAEVCALVKSDLGLRKRLVIVLTSSKDEGDRALSYDIGVTSYLVKPVSSEEFLDMDRELVRAALEEGPGTFTITEAASRTEFETCLVKDAYDIVLSDFDILGFEGLQVSDAVHAGTPNVPVVIVTGTGPEQVAVEAKKRGAADYVIKTPRSIDTSLSLFSRPKKRAKGQGWG
jgi:CheY-like chemotaxis protein